MFAGSKQTLEEQVGLRVWVLKKGSEETWGSLRHFPPFANYMSVCNRFFHIHCLPNNRAGDWMRKQMRVQLCFTKPDTTEICKHVNATLLIKSSFVLENVVIFHKNVHDGLLILCK